MGGLGQLWISVINDIENVISCYTCKLHTPNKVKADYKFCHYYSIIADILLLIVFIL